MSKTRKRPRLAFEFMFHPLGFVDSVEYDVLEEQLRKQAPIPVFKLRALRRRNTWAIELPLGIFQGDVTPGSTDLSTEVLERERVLRLIKEKTGSFHMDKTRDIIHRDGVWYYRRKALEQFRIYVHPNTLFVAAFNLLKAAELDPTVIMGAPETTARPLTDRPVIDGHRARGPSWTERDDYVLRKWFGRWADGKHHVLTDAQWATVLDELRGFRSKEAVKHRLSVLNAATKRSLMTDGYIKRDAVKAYLEKFLGERAVVPRFRPRLDGSYYPSNASTTPKKRPAAARQASTEPPLVTHLDLF